MNDMEIATDLTKKMLKRKAEPNALILVQYYLESEVQDRVDFNEFVLNSPVKPTKQMLIYVLKIDYLKYFLFH